MGMIVNCAAYEGGRRIARVGLHEPSEALELRLSYGYPRALATVVVLCSDRYYRFKRAGWF